MFREIMRNKQALSEEACIEILKKEKRGVLSVNGTEGYPYGLPIDHWYCEENGRIYFHCGKEGHKIDALKQDSHACYTIYGEGVPNSSSWVLNFRSVVVFGEISFVEDPERIAHICRQLSYQFTDDENYIDQEIKHSLARTLVLELTPHHISGKRVNES